MKLPLYYRTENIIGLYIIDLDKTTICRESVLIIIFFKCKRPMCMDLISHETCFCMSQTSIFSSESFPRYKLIFEGAPNNQQVNWTYKGRIIIH